MSLSVEKVTMPTEDHTPTTEAEWLALAGRLWDDGFDDDAAAIRVFWPTIAETIAGGVPLEAALKQVRRHSARLARLARRIEERSFDR